MTSKIDVNSTKIIELSQSISEEKNNIERIDKLYEFKSKYEYKMLNLEQRLKDITDNFNEAIYSLKKTINESISYPSVIGQKSKFRDFHAFIDYTINNISDFNLFKDKMKVSGVTNFQTKLDKTMKGYKAEIDIYISSTKKFATDNLITFDNKVNTLSKTFEEKLEEEKNNLQKNMDEIEKKYDEINNNINNLKNELMDKIGIHDEENEKKFLNLNSKCDKNFSDLDSIHKKFEETDDYIKKIFLEYDNKIKDQENKFSSKLDNLLSSLNYSNYPKTGKKSFDENHKNKNNFDKNFLPNFKSLDSSNSLKDTDLIKNKIKKSIESDMNLNNISSSKDKKGNKENSPIINSNNNSEQKVKLSKYINQDYIPYISNIKLFNLFNDSIKSCKDNSDNKLFMNRKKIDSYIMEKENFLINRLPKKQIIKNLLKGSADQLSYYIKENKEEKKNELNKIIYNQKAFYYSKKNLNSNDYLKERFLNSPSQLLNKEKFFEKNSNNNSKDNDNQELDEFIRTNKRIFSSMSPKTRNIKLKNSMRHNSKTGYNTSNKIKDKKSTIIDEIDKNSYIKNNKNFISTNKKFLRKSISPMNQSFNPRQDNDGTNRTSIHFFLNAKNQRLK